MYSSLQGSFCVPSTILILWALCHCSRDVRRQGYSPPTPAPPQWALSNHRCSCRSSARACSLRAEMLTSVTDHLCLLNSNEPLSKYTWLLKGWETTRWLVYFLFRSKHEYDYLRESIHPLCAQIMCCLNSRVDLDTPCTLWATNRPNRAPWCYVYMKDGWMCVSAAFYRLSWRRTSSTWSPAATGGKRWHAAQTPDAVYRFPPASSAPSAAPALAPESNYRHEEPDVGTVKLFSASGNISQIKSWPWHQWDHHCFLHAYVSILTL